MRRMMEHYKSVFKTIIKTFVFLLLIISCSERAKKEFYSKLSILGLNSPIESRLNLLLGEQCIEKPFSFKYFCKEHCDSVYIIPPYFDTDKPEFLNIKMSLNLRGYCNNNINFDSFCTIIFISKGEVVAFSEIERTDADFATFYFTDVQQLFSIEQEFIIDANRDVKVCYKQRKDES